MNWDIFALRYGYQNRSVPDNFGHSSDLHDQSMPLDFHIWRYYGGTFRPGC